MSITLLDKWIPGVSPNDRPRVVVEILAEAFPLECAEKVYLAVKTLQ